MFVESIPFQAGFTARNAQMSKERNPYLHLGAPRRLWELGWQYGDVLANEELYNDESELKRVDADPMEQGINAYKAGLDKVECPYGEGDRYGTDEEKATYQARWQWLFGYAHAEGSAKAARDKAAKAETDKSVVNVTLNFESTVNGMPLPELVRKIEGLFGKVDRDPNAV